MCTGDCDQGRVCSCCSEAPKQLQLAPGVVQGYRISWAGTPAQRRELLRWLKPALAFTTVVALCGLAVGVIAGRFYP